MSKMADFILEFLETIADNSEYHEHQWDWENLPSYDKMWEIVDKHRGDNL